MSTTAAAPWQNLPADILLMIAEPSQIRHLRAVCSSWRSSLPLPYKPHRPLRSVQIPPPPFFIRDHQRLYGDYLSVPSSYLTLTECNIYCLEPLGNDDADSPESCWIVKLEEKPLGKMRFYNLFSHWSTPPVSRLNLPAAVDFLDCRVNLVVKEYTLRVTHNFFPPYKVVLSNDAMLCLFDNKKSGYFKFGDERWTMIETGLFHFITDIIYHKQKFYVVREDGQTMVIDSSLKVKEFVSPAGYGDWSFVQSDGDLFVVNKYKFGNNPNVRFTVYRLNSDEQQWNKVTNLGDQSFFISRGCAFSIGSGQFSGCRKNFIYYALLGPLKEWVAALSDLGII